MFSFQCHLGNCCLLCQETNEIHAKCVGFFYVYCFSFHYPFFFFFFFFFSSLVQVSFARNTESQEAEELSRLKDEVAMLGHINHPNIVRCLGATQHDRHINIFIEWMAGEWAGG